MSILFTSSHVPSSLVSLKISNERIEIQEKMHVRSLSASNIDTSQSVRKRLKEMEPRLEKIFMSKFA